MELEDVLVHSLKQKLKRYRGLVAFLAVKNVLFEFHHKRKAEFKNLYLNFYIKLGMIKKKIVFLNILEIQYCK